MNNIPPTRIIDLYAMMARETAQQEYEVGRFAVSAEATELTGTLAWELRAQLLSELRRFRLAAAEAAQRGDETFETPFGSAPFGSTPF